MITGTDSVIQREGSSNLQIKLGSPLLSGFNSHPSHKKQKIKNKMDKFIGTINGVQYTDSKEFFNALQEGWENEMIHSISYSASRTNEPVEKQEPVKEPSNMNSFLDYDKFVQNIFSAFMGALLGHNAPVNKRACDPIQPQNPVEKQEPEKHAPENKNEFFSVDAIVNKYVMKQTTYQFTGTDQDDQELDKFDKYLLDKSIEFQKEDLHLATKECLDAIKGYFTRAMFGAEQGKHDTENRLRDIDEKMAKYEKLIEIQEEIGDEVLTEYNNTKERYSSLTDEFDKVEAEQNYYRLLIEYYTNLVNHLNTFIDEKN